MLKSRTWNKDEREGTGRPEWKMEMAGGERGGQVHESYTPRRIGQTWRDQAMIGGSLVQSV